MANYLITYANHLDEDGNTFEFPTDEFDANGVEIETFEFVESETRDGEDFARETWRYQIDENDAGRFEIGVSRIGSAIEWKREEAQPA